MSAGERKGLSPRGRGNRSLRPTPSAEARSIPAWAGQPVTVSPGIVISKVYPRVGGATIIPMTRNPTKQGLSPRGRGNLGPSARPSRRHRSIPAWAGQPHGHCCGRRRPWVYPRVGGATLLITGGAESRGGLSPRGRGNRCCFEAATAHTGSIPAWAGQPPLPPPRTAPSRVYPRVGGATTSTSEPVNAMKGLSPRGRGNQGCPRWLGRPGRSIPAWAGQPLTRRCQSRRPAVYPRVGGATNGPRDKMFWEHGLSPRGRGNHLPPSRMRGHSGSIPAWAGQPAIIYAAASPDRVYPRVGGATHSNSRPFRVPDGLSPRGRGNRRQSGRCIQRAGSIPAWAGQPR